MRVPAAFAVLFVCGCSSSSSSSTPSASVAVIPWSQESAFRQSSDVKAFEIVTGANLANPAFIQVVGLTREVFEQAKDEERVLRASSALETDADETALEALRREYAASTQDGKVTFTEADTLLREAEKALDASGTGADYRESVKVSRCARGSDSIGIALALTWKTYPESDVARRRKATAAFRSLGPAFEKGTMTLEEGKLLARDAEALGSDASKGDAFVAKVEAFAAAKGGSSVAPGGRMTNLACPSRP